MINHKEAESWAAKEFEETKLGDRRLTDRLVKIADKLSIMPESPINQACGGWSEVKAAYRFFQNENIKEKAILATHISKTVERIERHKVILAIQDTSYFTYSNHKKTTGLGIICTKVGTNIKNIETKGLIMHTTLAVSTKGLPLGILDQKIYARPEISEKQKALKKKSHGNALSIEDKESIRWLESLKNTNQSAEKTIIVTVCDREADIYDFFALAHKLNKPVLIRAAQDRNVNKKSMYSKKKQTKLRDVLENMPCTGMLSVEVPTRNNQPARVANLEIKFGEFTMNPPRNNIKNRTETLSDIPLRAIYVVEKHPPSGVDPLEWILVTNLAIYNFDEAIEKVRWYCLRWRIEVFHKILKSGLKVEECRLSSGERLIRYLTVMSIIAWRIFFITLISRADPSLSCAVLLEEEEWKVLYAKMNKVSPNSNTPPPTMKEAVTWIAKLGGYLARKKDPEPGPIVIWRGWKRLFDLVSGWELAISCTCG